MAQPRRERGLKLGQWRCSCGFDPPTEDELDDHMMDIYYQNRRLKKAGKQPISQPNEHIWSRLNTPITG